MREFFWGKIPQQLFEKKREGKFKFNLLPQCEISE